MMTRGEKCGSVAWTGTWTGTGTVRPGRRSRLVGWRGGPVLARGDVPGADGAEGVAEFAAHG